MTYGRKSRARVPVFDEDKTFTQAQLDDKLEAQKVELEEAKETAVLEAANEATKVAETKAAAEKKEADEGDKGKGKRYSRTDINKLLETEKRKADKKTMGLAEELEALQNQGEPPSDPVSDALVKESDTKSALNASKVDKTVAETDKLQAETAGSSQPDCRTPRPQRGGSTFGASDRGVLVSAYQGSGLGFSLGQDQGRP